MDLYFEKKRAELRKTFDNYMDEVDRLIIMARKELKRYSDDKAAEGLTAVKKNS